MAEEIAFIDRLNVVEHQTTNVLSRVVVALTQRMRTLEATVESLSDALPTPHAHAESSTETLSDIDIDPTDACRI